MLRCVDRWQKYGGAAIGQSYQIVAPLPRPLSGHSGIPLRHGVFDIVGFCAANEHTRSSRGSAHLALVRFRKNGKIQRLALWIIARLPEVA